MQLLPLLQARTTKFHLKKTSKVRPCSLTTGKPNGTHYVTHPKTIMTKSETDASSVAASVAKQRLYLVGG